VSITITESINSLLSAKRCCSGLIEPDTLIRDNLYIKSKLNLLTLMDAD
jgi:hypothetical protein